MHVSPEANVDQDWNLPSSTFATHTAYAHNSLALTLCLQRSRTCSSLISSPPPQLSLLERVANMQYSLIWLYLKFVCSSKTILYIAIVIFGLCAPSGKWRVAEMWKQTRLKMGMRSGIKAKSWHQSTLYSSADHNPNLHCPMKHLAIIITVHFCSPIPRSSLLLLSVLQLTNSRVLLLLHVYI